jgi:hypothetical protein
MEQRMSIDRYYLNPLEYRYRLRSSPLHSFVVGHSNNMPVIAGVIQNLFLILRFTTEGSLVPGPVPTWPIRPEPEAVRYSTRKARRWYRVLAKQYGITVLDDETIEVQRFFLRERDAPIETFLNWCPGPVIADRCPYLPIGIDDLPWSMQAFLKDPESYPPAQRAEQQKDVDDYQRGATAYIFWWLNSYFIDPETGEVIGT